MDSDNERAKEYWRTLVKHYEAVGAIRALCKMGLGHHGVLAKMDPKEALAKILKELEEIK